MTNIFWPAVDDLWSSKKACIQASSVAFLVGTATGVMTFMQFKGIKILDGLSGVNFIDAAVFLILGIFIYRCSRIASLIGLALYASGQVLLFQHEHRVPTMAVFFCLFLTSGIRGAFAFHEMKTGLSPEEIKTTLKTLREDTEPQISKGKRIVAWIVLIALAGGGYGWYRKSHPGTSATVRDSQPAPVSKISPDFGALSVLKNVQSFVQKANTTGSGPASAPSSEGKQSFKLKDGSTITGRVIKDDPVYYTVETFGGRQEIVIKEDIAS